MKPDIYYPKKGGLFVHPKLHGEWVVKAPTRANRLHKSGSAGLKMAEKYDLDHNKKGVLFIDHSARAYVMIPKELMGTPVGKNCQGVKNSIFSYDVNHLVNTHNLELVRIPAEDSIIEDYDTGLAGDIRSKFGLNGN